MTIHYGTKNIYDLHCNGVALLQDCIEDVSSATGEQIECILSIQDRVYRDIHTKRWRIDLKKKRGGHLDLEKFRTKLLKKI